MKNPKSKKEEVGGDANVIDFPAQQREKTPEDASRQIFSWDLTICQIKITLKNIDPPIWRRILVPQDTKLPKFHRIIQCVMGWQNCHLHEFRIGPLKFGEPVPEEHYDVLGERNVKLSHIERGDEVSFEYRYDFGDQWEHTVVIEKMLLPEEESLLPFCVDGARACPPEDCGGPAGYQRLLETLADPRHPEHEEMRDWVGEYFNPERFIPEIVNFKLKTLR